MSDKTKHDNQARDEESGKASKPRWVKPMIRASGEFELQAIACARPGETPPIICNSATS